MRQMKISIKAEPSEGKENVEPVVFKVPSKPSRPRAMSRKGEKESYAKNSNNSTESTVNGTQRASSPGTFPSRVCVGSFPILHN